MFNNELLRLGALAIAPDQKAVPFSGEAWLYALEMTLMGLGMIFSVLAILWGVLVIFKLVFAGKSEKPKKENLEKTVKIESPEVKVAPAKSAPTPAANGDAELIAILTAAIAAYEAEQNPNAPALNFRVVSYRRANGGRSWNAK
jgi:sodium pump decarboxylase gamma subunit